MTVKLRDCDNCAIVIMPFEWVKPMKQLNPPENRRWAKEHWPDRDAVHRSQFLTSALVLLSFIWEASC